MIKNLYLKIKLYAYPLYQASVDCFYMNFDSPTKPKLLKMLFTAALHDLSFQKTQT